MKRFLVLSLLSLIAISSFSQDFEFRIRGGANFQKAIGLESEFSLYSHVGAMAGVRISTIGIYGELLYSAHEEANGAGAINYIAPSILARFYTYRFIYVEGGLSYYILSDDSEPGILPNPDKEIGFYGGLGVTYKRIEAGLRSSMNPFSTIQFTASFKF